MGTVSYEVCDKCNVTIPPAARDSWLRRSFPPVPYPHVSIEIKHAKYGWGHGSDDPCLRGDWVLCEECYGKFLKALKTFINVWEE